MQITKIAIPGKKVELEHPVEVTIVNQYDIDFEVIDGVLYGFFEYEYVFAILDAELSDGTHKVVEDTCVKNESGSNMIKIIPKKNPYITGITLTISEVSNNVQ